VNGCGEKTVRHSGGDSIPTRNASTRPFRSPNPRRDRWRGTARAPPPHTHVDRQAATGAEADQARRRGPRIFLAGSGRRGRQRPAAHAGSSCRRQTQENPLRRRSRRCGPCRHPNPNGHGADEGHDEEAGDGHVAASTTWHPAGVECKGETVAAMPIWTVRLRPERQGTDVPDEIRIRRALKVLLRDWGLRCVDLSGPQQDQRPAAMPAPPPPRRRRRG
jgi:hypothetical protein